ncbi:MAG: hypothetical protein U0441_10565 [Polyangiaceae bacterium]
MTLVGCTKGSGETGGSSAGGTGGAGGATTTVPEGGGGAGGSAVDPKLFAGVDVSKVELGTAPTGCEGGFDASKGLLSLTFATGMKGLLLGVVAGKIQANGVNCTAADGSYATTDVTKDIEVHGTDADEFVIVDLATGGFGAKVFGDGGITVDLGGGKDAFALRGSLDDDTVAAGSDADKHLVLDVSKRGAPDIDVANSEAFWFSFGPGKDVFRGTGIAGGAHAAMALALFGDDGDDDLMGGDGDDAMHGGAGDDLFTTEDVPDGADLFDGGAGTDKVDYGARKGNLVITMAGGADDGEAGEKDDVNATVEVLFAGAGDDTVTGNDLDNEIHGALGADLLHGGLGADTLFGDAGDDTLFGDDGDDNLSGQEGIDTLSGGDGADTLDGGDGADKYDGGAGDGDICLIDPSEDPVDCELY